MNKMPNIRKIKSIYIVAEADDGNNYDFDFKYKDGIISDFIMNFERDYDNNSAVTIQFNPSAFTLKIIPEEDRSVEQGTDKAYEGAMQ